MEAAALVDIARAILVPLALYCISWSWTGPWDLLRGKGWPVAIYRSSIFCLGLFTLGFQITHFLTIEEVGSGPWALAWLIIAIGAHGFAAWGRLAGHYALGERFYWLILGGHLSAALAMADYHAACPEQADALAERLRKRTARCVVKDDCDD